jgi:capsular polysaccharide biosynthesis protein
MNPAEYLKILARRWWILLAAAVIVGASAAVFSRLQTPVYRATQQIYIKPARNDNGLSETILKLLNGYRAWMDTKERAERVIANYAREVNGRTTTLDMTPDQLKSMVTISVDRNASLLTVDVDMRDGEVANLVARSYGEIFKQWRDTENAPLRLEDRINAELLDFPAYGQTRPQTTVNTVAGVVLGVLLGGVIVFLLETLSARIIRRSHDIEQTLALPVLGAIPDSAPKSEATA